MLRQFDYRQGIGDLFQNGYNGLQIIFALRLRSIVQVQFVPSSDYFFYQDLDNRTNGFIIRPKDSLRLLLDLRLVCCCIGLFDG